jgi:uracil-DNA glycosylase family 4
MREPDWHNGPVQTLLPAGGDGHVRLLIVGLAPGLRGANRTGIPFTGDASGTMLFSTLKRHGLLRIRDDGTPDPIATAITNAVRCVPPKNRPTGAETRSCSALHLSPTIKRFENLETIVTLGRIAHDATVRSLGDRPSRHPFGSNAVSRIGGYHLRSSYHCSRYNQNTGRLTVEMFDAVFSDILR